MLACVADMADTEFVHGIFRDCTCVMKKHLTDDVVLGARSGLGTFMRALKLLVTCLDRPCGLLTEAEVFTMLTARGLDVVPSLHVPVFDVDGSVVADQVMPTMWTNTGTLTPSYCVCLGLLLRAFPDAYARCPSKRYSCPSPGSFHGLDCLGCRLPFCLTLADQVLRRLGVQCVL